MIDLHCHIMPGIDDGAKDLHTSLAILNKARLAGITDVVLTPHFIKDSIYNFANTPKSQILDILRIAVKNAGIKINLHLGNEVFLDPKLVELLKSGQVATLAGSKYVLIELPVRAEDAHAKDILFSVINNGYTPVIAHPERYLYFQNDPGKIQEYIDLGCLMQGDYQSLHGRYGKHAKSALKTYLKRGQIHFLASDIHKSTTDYNLAETRRKLLKILRSEEKVATLLEGNPHRVLLNQPVIREEEARSALFSLPKFNFRAKISTP